MIKILEKVRYFLFGERSISEKCDLIVKDKKLTDNQKLTRILENYGRYYQLDHHDAANMECFELYYERFMYSGYKNEYEYSRCYDACDKDIVYANTICLIKQVKSLQLDYSQCSNGELKILKSLKYLDNYVYNDNFDYEAFYTNEILKQRVATENAGLVEQLKDYSAKQISHLDEQEKE